MTSTSSNETLSYETFIVERHACGYSVTLNRPQVRNAINQVMVQELLQFMALIQQDETVRALTIRGSAGHFCAGGDISDMLEAAQHFESGDAEAFRQLNLSYGQLLVNFARLSCTTIALLEGTVMGGGLGFAAVADITLCTRGAKLAMPEASLGLPPAQIAAFVAERIGLSQTRRLALSARRISGEEALRLGLIDQLLENSDALEQQLKTELSAIQTCSPKAIRATKNLLVNSSRLAFKHEAELQAHLSAAADAFSFAVTQGDGPEGTRAFMEKRQPSWAITH